MVLDVKLQLLNFFEVTVDLHLETIIFRFEVISLMDHIRQVLVPLCALPLVVQQEFSLLRLGLRAFGLKFALLLVEGLTLLFHLLLEVRQLLVSLLLHGIQLGLKAFDGISKLFNLLAQVSLLIDLVTARQF